MNGRFPHGAGLFRAADAANRETENRQVARPSRPISLVGSAGATGRCNGSAVLHLSFGRYGASAS
ncbi:hypothetical protein IE4771_PB00352 (plasmid) [Rhizobium etli bv. mimosae str. IE4771]|uniref:Uncharacterized protein n=1 Tax=Rhizobium etli bv. mimosae str. IE4771 TaxID=1432050 RepID=A0A060I4V4_RHIET|nr:hypothetical protein IE4771_PB00352 [Rhizobium sp. IE4771]